MPNLPPAAIGEAYTATEGWELLANLSDLDDRMPGHEGESMGAALVSEAFESAGIDATTTTFPIPGWWRGPCSLRISRGGRESIFEQSHEIVGLPGTPAGEITGEIVDMGHGLPEDFEGADLSGSIAMASSLTPDDYGRWVHRSEKYSYAAESGAEGFIFYNHIEGALPPTGSIGEIDGPGPIPAVGLSKELGVRLSRYCEGTERTTGIDATLTVDARNEPATSRNVEAVVGPDTDEAVLFTAHVDGHDVGTAANDNGFGTALVTSVAQILARLEDDLDTKVRFVVFGAEETGLYGSYYWSHTHDLDRVTCILNVDGIGYSRDLQVHTHGFEAIGEAFESVADEFEIPIEISDGIRPHSDHWPFVQRGVPGAQGRSASGESGRGWGHTHGDTLDKLDIRDLRELSVVCAAGLLELASNDRAIERCSPESIESATIEEGYEVGMRATGSWPWDETPRPWPWTEKRD